MSVNIGELDSEIAVHGEPDQDAPPAATEPSRWAEQERLTAMEHRSAELRARTAARGFHD